MCLCVKLTFRIGKNATFEFMKQRIVLLFLGCMLVTVAQAQRGLKSYKEDRDKEVCSSCLTTLKTIPLDVSYGFKVENGKIYFTISDHTYLDKLFPKAADAIAIDVVTRSQYQCGRPNTIKFTDINKGKLIEPVGFEVFKKDIEINDKTGWGTFYLADLPRGMESEEYELNMLFIKDNIVCFTNTFYGISKAKWELLEMGLYIDTTSYKMKELTTTKVTYQDHQKELKFIIPFKKNKWDYSPADIKPLYDSLRLTDYRIIKIDIHGYSSVEGTTSNNIKLQNKRANSMVEALKTFQSEDIETSVTSSENWVEFINDMEDAGKEDIVVMSKSQIKNELNNNGLSDELEPYLKNHRKAVVRLELKKRTRHEEKTTEYVVDAFKQSVIDKDLQKALEFQQELFVRFGNSSLSDSILSDLEIPDDSSYVALLSNKCVFNFQKNKNIPAAIDAFEQLHQKYPNNNPILYNLTALKLMRWAQGEMLPKTRTLKLDILALEKSNFNEKLTDRMMLNFHIARSAQSLQEGDLESLERSVNFVKGKYRRAYWDDEDMIRVANFLTTYDREDWAQQVLYPHAKRIDADEDLVYLYVNLTMMNPDKIDNEKHKSAMLNAINRNQEKFCKLFASSADGGVSFQLLSNRYLKKIYCETCEGKEEDEEE